MKLKKRIFNVLFYLLNICVIGIILVFCVFYYYGRNLPSELTLLDYLPPTSTRLYSSDGELIEEYAIEHRTFVPLDKIPIMLQGAFLIAEDKEFYHHGGISIPGILRALIENTVKNIWSQRPAGGSTITQQVAKNLLVGNAKKFSRKIKEAIMAFRIESSISKQKIFEIYLNQLYLGYGCYGVVAACDRYFGKEISNITADEAAFLAAIPSAPAMYTNTLNSKKLLIRRNSILYQLYNLGYINKAQLKASVNSPIRINNIKRKYFAPYFADEIFRQISSKVSKYAFCRCGYEITTTLDKKVQYCATKALEDGLINFQKTKKWKYTDSKSLPHTINKIIKCKVLEQNENNIKLLSCTDTNNINVNNININNTSINNTSINNTSINNTSINNTSINNTSILNIQNSNVKLRKNDYVLCRQVEDKYELYTQPEVTGGIIVMNPDNGDILGLSGGFSFDISSFNCMTQGKRQPGSTIKPFVYAAALEQGMNEEDIIEDKTISIKLSDGTYYKPHNYNNKALGDVSLKFALINSLNLATVDLAQKVGMPSIRKLLKDLKLIDKDVPISAVLGSTTVSPLQLISAFSIFYNEGIMVFPKFIKHINQYNKQYVNNSLINSMNVVNFKRVISKETAVNIKNILHETMHTTSTAKIAELEQKYNIQVFGKTGTTNDFKDAWFIGGFNYKNNRYLVCVFVGYDIPKSLGDRQYGAVVALPIFCNFVDYLLKDM